MNCFEKVTVNAQAIVNTQAINWLKEKYPELCIKAGLCERIGGRLYTKTFIDPPAAQPEQEPLMDAIRAEPTAMVHKWRILELVKCYTTPPAQQRKPLTDERILHFVNTHVGGPSPGYPLDNSDWINFARAIEAAHGIKEKK
jgi:hypothetical protein